MTRHGWSVRSDLERTSCTGSGRALICAVALSVATTAAANLGGGPTGCSALCPSVWEDYVLNETIAPCVVGIGVNEDSPYDADVDVVPGSHIQCGPLEVRVTSYDLNVADGGYLIEASQWC
jgi:cytochrome c biogenesis factor